MLKSSCTLLADNCSKLFQFKLIQRSRHIHLASHTRDLLGRKRVESFARRVVKELVFAE